MMEKKLYNRNFLKDARKSSARNWKPGVPMGDIGIQHWIWLPCHARWIFLSRSFPNTSRGSIPPSVSGLPRYVLRLPKRWFWRSQTIAMIWFLPSAASLPAPISTVCSKRKKAVLLRLGERKTVKKYVLGVAFPHECDTFFVGMRHQCGGMRHLVSKKNTIFAPWKV